MPVYHLEDNGQILILLSSFTGIEEVKSKMKELGYDIKEKNKERISFEQLLVLAGTKFKGI